MTRPSSRFAQFYKIFFSNLQPILGSLLLVSIASCIFLLGNRTPIAEASGLQQDSVAGDYVVFIRQTTFDPPLITIKVGDRVTWQNSRNDTVVFIPEGKRSHVYLPLVQSSWVTNNASQASIVEEPSASTRSTDSANSEFGLQEDASALPSRSQLQPGETITIKFDQPGTYHFSADSLSIGKSIIIVEIDPSTPTPTATNAPTTVGTPTETATTDPSLPTATETATTDPLLETPTETPVGFPTSAPSATRTATATRTPTHTPLPTNTGTATATPTNTGTATTTPTTTDTPLPTMSPTPLQSPTQEPQATAAPPIADIFSVVPVTSNITVDTIWTTGNVYTITGIITVNTGINLTIEPGVLVQFGTDSKGHLGRLVLNGRLNAMGEPSQRIVFTSLKDDDYGGDTLMNGDSTWGSHGDWSGLVFNSTSSGSVLNHVLVANAGGGGGVDAASISVNGAAIELLNSEIIYSGFNGVLWKDNAAGTISGNVINVNLGNGIKLRTASYPLIEGNTIVHNRAYAIFQEGNSFPEIWENTVYGNGFNAIGVMGTVGTGQWYVNANMPYVIADTVFVAPNATLTLPQGLVVKFIGGKSLVVRGGLSALGNESEPIVFTSLKDDGFGGDTQQDGAATKPIAGDWGSLYFADTTLDESILSYTKISYGGSGYQYGSDVNATTYANLAVDSASPTIEFSTIENGAKYGIQLLNVSTSLIQNNQIQYNKDSGLWISADSAPLIHQNVFWANGGFAAYVNGSSSASFVGSWAKGNRINGIGMTGNFNDDIEWGLDMPYVVDGTIVVAPNIAVTVTTGAVVKFMPNGKITLNGRLIAVGDETNRVTFTSIKDDSLGGDTNGDGISTAPAPGDWEAIIFNSQSTGSIMDYVTLRYAGSNSTLGAITLYDAAPILDHLIVMGSKSHGVYGYGSAAVIENSIFAYNNIGIYNDTNASLSVHNSDLYSNTLQAVFNAVAGHALDATYNWWGSDKGPRVPSNAGGNGDVINGNVIFEPWLKEPPVEKLGRLPTTPSPKRYTIVGGNLSFNTVWTTAQSPYIVMTDVTVITGVNLRIDPGVIVKFASGKSLIVNGSLDATGNVSQRIMFTSNRDDTLGGDTNGDRTATLPQPGDWGRIFFADSTIDQTTRLRFTEVRYGGIIAGKVIASVYIDSSSPLIEDNVIVKGAGYGMHLRNLATPPLRRNYILDNFGGGIFLEKTSAGSFENNQFWGNSGFAVYMDGSCFPDFLGNVSFYNENNGARIAGSMTFNQEWKPNLTYVIDQPLTVESGATLRIEPGTIVKFADPTSSLILKGGFIADSQPSGSALSRIYFTSLDDDKVGGDTNNDDGSMWPLLGDWGFIEFDDSSKDGETLLRKTTVRYGGNGMIRVESSQPEIVDNDINSALGFAMYVSNQANPSITNNMIYGNGTGAIKIWDHSYPVLTNNTMWGNSGFVMDMSADSKPILVTNLISDNSYNAIRVSGILDSEMIWDVNVPTIPYAPDDVTINGGAKLTLQPGTILKFLPGADWLLNGPLFAEGTAEKPVIMTSIKDDTFGTPVADTNSDGNFTMPAEKDWNKLTFNSGASGSSLSNFVLRYGGLPTIKIVKADITIDSGQIEFNQQGLWFEDGNAEIYNSTFTSNIEYAIYETDSNLNIHDNSFIENGRAIYIRRPDSAHPPVSTNLFNNNKEYAYYTDMNAFYLLDDSNTFENTIGNVVWLDDGVSTTARTFTQEDTTLLTGRVYKFEQAIAPITSTLTIQPGTVVKFAPGGGLTVRGALYVGALDGEPVVMTSFKDDSAAGDSNNDNSATIPAAGDWANITIDNNDLEIASTAAFENTIIRYGGSIKALVVVPKHSEISFTGSELSYSKKSGISLNSTSGGFFNALLTVTDSIIRNNLEDGIVMDSVKQLTPPKEGTNTLYVAASLIANNGNAGIWIDLPAVAEIHGSDIVGNLDYGVYAADPLVDATQNWWGHANGPTVPFTGNDYGDAVGKVTLSTSNIDFSNHETAPVTLLTSAGLQSNLSSSENDAQSKQVFLPLVTR